MSPVTFVRISPTLSSAGSRAQSALPASPKHPVPLRSSFLRVGGSFATSSTMSTFRLALPPRYSSSRLAHCGSTSRQNAAHCSSVTHSMKVKLSCFALPSTSRNVASYFPWTKATSAPFVKWATASLRLIATGASGGAGLKRSPHAPAIW